MIGFELYQAVRRLVERPLWTAAVVGTLGLSLGASTALFSLLYGVLLRPLPFSEPERLTRVYQTYEELRGSPNPRLQALWNRLPMSYLNAVESRREEVFAGLGLYLGITTSLEIAAEPRRLEGAQIDSELFDVLRVRPALGRDFSRDEVERGARRVILAYPLWREAFGGRDEALGDTLRLEGEAYTVVGVMPPGFHLPDRESDLLWTPLRLTEEDRRDRDNFAYSALARLSSDAGGQPFGDAPGRRREGPGAGFLMSREGIGVRMVPLAEDVLGDHRPSLALLYGAIALIFLIGCVNVLHLLLAQGLARRRELAIRRALGAGGSRLVGGLLLESLLLALAGGAVGLALAFLGQQSLLAGIPADLPRRSEIALDEHVLAFTLGLSLLALLLCGLPSAWVVCRARSLAGLGWGGGRSGGRRYHHDAFVVVQIALSLALVVGAGLLVRSFLSLSAVPPGFRTEGLLVQEIQLPESRYGQAHHRKAFAADLLEELRSLPGVGNVALTTKLPFAGKASVWGFQIPDRDVEAEENWTRGRSAAMKFVSPSYFRVLDLDVRSGRAFTPADGPEGRRAVMVNETLAEHHWPDGSAVGQQVILGASEETYTVVGVVRNLRHDGLAAEPGELMYQPWSQGPALTMAVLLEVKGDPLSHAPVVRQVLRGLDPLLPLPPTQTMEGLLSESLDTPRSRTALLGILAFLALALAGIGTFAVMSLAVQRRLPEWGIRIALGATAAGIRRRVLRRTLSVALLGITLGAPAAFFTAALLDSQLYGVAPRDPLSFLSAALLLAVTALAASYLPARRASRVDPLEALRSE